MHVLEGALTVTIAGTEHAPADGDAIVMLAKVPFGVAAAGAAKWMLVLLKTGGAG